MLEELFNETLRKRTKPEMFKIYPVYKDRKVWESINPGLRKHIIDEAEKLIGCDWPRFKASDYMEYYKTGSRNSFDSVFESVFDPLTKLAMAECVEGKGRFIEDIANGVFARCEDTSWIHTGHLQHYGDETIPRDNGEYLDLRCCSTGKQLALIYYLMGDELRELCPWLIERLENEIKVRILDRYIETDQWWTNFEEGHTINNWNTHCNECVIITAMIMEKDRDRLIEIMDKACRSLDVFLSIYEDDGACNEGPGYWKGASFSYLGILILIAEIYGVDFDSMIDGRIINMGSYIYKVLIHEDWYMSYADGNGRNPMYDVKLYLAGKALHDDAMMNMAVDVFRRNRNKGIFYDHFICVLHDYIEYVMHFGELSKKSSEVTNKSYYLKSAVLPDANIFAARIEAGSEKGLFAAIKGGHNDESHNHNDIGCPYVYLDGEPVIIDAGAGAYTIKTFSPERYDIWTMQSDWHSLPKINGFSQSAGILYKSKDFKWEDDGFVAGASMNISDAYPTVARIDSYTRRISLDRRSNEVCLEDEIRLNEICGETVFHLLLKGNPKLTEAGRIEVDLGKNRALIEYDGSSFDYSFDEKDLSDDKKLYESWGYTIYKVNLVPSSNLKEYHIRIRIRPL